MRRGVALVAISLLAVLAACGGGGSGSPSTTSTVPTTTTPIPQGLHIVTGSTALPGALIGKPYSTTMTAAGGQPPYHWALSQPPNGVPGLGLDAGSGTLSGTPTATGYYSLLISLSDSSSPQLTAKIPMNLTVVAPLQASAATVYALQEFVSGSVSLLSVQGGVQPLTYSLTGQLPGGVKLDTRGGSIGGTPIVQGQYPISLTVTDSFSPPETATIPVSLIVAPPPFSLAASLPPRLAVNRAFSGKVIAEGGVPPYTFSLNSGSTLPPGLTFDASNGELSGTPTTVGQYYFWVNAADSNSPPSHTTQYYSMDVATPIGRNDSVSTATPISNGAVSASISPYEDPPTASSVPGDRDYYKVVAQGGQVVHLQVSTRASSSGRLLDTVLEVVDANNNVLNTCGPPNSLTLTLVCVNDDSGGSTDSAIDVQVPGPANATNAIYAVVLDWRGDARPDMSYSLQVSGAIAPLALQGFQNPIWSYVGASGQKWTFLASGGGVPYTWSVSSGSLPPGLALDPSGVISGTPTTAGSYPFTLQVTDMLAQTLQENVTFNVAAPLSLTSTSPVPDATAGTPYSYPFTTVGGGSPLYWQIYNPSEFFGGLNLNGLGVLTGTAVQAGSYTFTITVSDPSQQRVSKDFAITIHPASSLTLTTDNNLTTIDGNVGFSLYSRIMALYGTPPYTLSITAGQLPPGVNYSTASYANTYYLNLTGTPTAKGTYVFTVSAVDSSTPAVSGSGTFTLIVN